ncbi:MAG: hypothetical protein ACRD19_00105 [Terriglobia bacterium]
MNFVRSSKQWTNTGSFPNAIVLKIPGILIYSLRHHRIAFLLLV